MGEKHDADEKIVWPINVAMTWNVLDDGKVEAEPVKNCYFRFEYRIILKHIITLNARPNRLHLPSWPKSNRFPVQLEYFEPLWPGIRHFLENMHEQKISSQDCWNYCDMLGALYHQWKFDESKLLELESLSYKLGFSRFFDGIGLEGDFFKMTQSTRTANIQRRSGKRVKMKNRRGKIEHKVVWELHLQRIRKDAQCIFKIFNGYQITVNFFSSTFRHTEYLSIGIALQGDVTHTEFVEMEFIFRFGNLETQDVTTRVRRRLDPVQNTICVPTVCTIEEIEKRLDTAENDVFLVEVHLEICSGECLEENKENILEMPGKNDVVLKFDEKKIAVNRDFLGHHVQFFRTLFFNENFDEHRRKILEISTAAYTEMVQFLDTLYHGTKSFKVCQFYHVLRMADEWICEKVVGIVEKALINCQIASVNKRKLAEKFNLMQLFKILQNNNKTGEVKKMRIL
uniref:BTB domain-containing protein n=1 Tax=Caenorhabditis japonica TaxID=281687 RepID=A0A8R1HYV0_CAEJA